MNDQGRRDPADGEDSGERGKRRRPPAPDPRRGAIIGLLVTLLLLILGLYLVKRLGDMGRVQDCAMSGRTNCDPIDTDSSGR
jgi:uncharacterized membrane protein